MKVEVYGARFNNKGAELMLQAICSKVEQEYKDGSGVLSYRAKFLFDKSHTDLLLKRFPSIPNVINFIPSFIRKKMRIIKDSELDFVLDASGFAFGDQWGLSTSRYFIGRLNHWRDLGVGIILMPQAFGPFLKPGMREAMQEIHDKTDFIFARDEVSFQLLKDVVGDSDKVQLAPDFTNLLTGKAPASFKHQGGTAIIPNWRMDNMTEHGKIYLDLLASTAKWLQSNNKNPFFLIHEGKGDHDIAIQVNKMLEQEIPVYSGFNAIEIKGVIAQSAAVISSRFHGLVSAMSQGIPCLGTGWSHKYVCLFQDYDYAAGLLEPEKWPHVDQYLETLFTPENYSDTSAKLLLNSKELKKQSEKVWDKVFNIMNAHKAKRLSR